jgi:hypothetical protein
MRLLAAVAVLSLAVAPAAPAAGAPSLTASGCPLFPSDSVWHAPVSRLPVHPRSRAYLAAMSPGAGIHADFGSGTWESGPIGIPLAVVPPGQPKVPMRFGYAAESDPGPYPIPPDAPVEGGPDATGDRHVLVVQAGSCRLYELFDAHRDGAGWRAGSGAVFDLRSNRLRPAGWTSAASGAARGARGTGPAGRAAPRRPARRAPAAAALLPGVGRRSLAEPVPIAAAGLADPSPAPDPAAARPAAGSGPELPGLLPPVLAALLGLVAASLAARVGLRPRRRAAAGRHPR